MVRSGLATAVISACFLFVPFSAFAAPQKASITPTQTADVAAVTSGWVHPTTGNFNLSSLACTIVANIFACGATNGQNADWEEIATMLEAKRVPARLAKRYPALAFYNITNGDLFITTGSDARKLAVALQTGKAAKKLKNTFQANTRANGGWAPNVAVTGLFILDNKKGFDIPVAAITIYADANRKAGMLITNFEDAINASEATGIDYKENARAELGQAGFVDPVRMKGALVSFINK